MERNQPIFRRPQAKQQPLSPREDVSTQTSAVETDEQREDREYQEQFERQKQLRKQELREKYPDIASADLDTVGSALVLGRHFGLKLDPEYKQLVEGKAEAEAKVEALAEQIARRREYLAERTEAYDNRYAELTNGNFCFTTDVVHTWGVTPQGRKKIEDSEAEIQQLKTRISELTQQIDTTVEETNILK